MPPVIQLATIQFSPRKGDYAANLERLSEIFAQLDALEGHARGASTITQQLVGNMHPDLVNRSDRSIG